jgi:hypothetical protein
MSSLQDEDRDYSRRSKYSNQHFEIKEKKMKPFSQGKPVVTRDGRKVLWITEIPEDIFYPIVGLIPHREHAWDLFMAPVQRVGWVAFGHSLYCDPAAMFCTHVWDTEEDAKNNYRAATDKEPKGTQRIEWEE